jgi:hypothetical protein
MLQTGAFVSIHALSQKKHAYGRLMLSSLIPLVYVSKPGRGRVANAFYANIWESIISDAP